MEYFRSDQLVTINESILSDDSNIKSVNDNSVKDNSVKLNNYIRYNNHHKIENDQKRARKERREYSRRLIQQNQSENINWMKSSSDFIVRRFIICCIN
jgi:hypothetical protein